MRYVFDEEKLAEQGAVIVKGLLEAQSPLHQRSLW
jgi:hypothetical protein